MSNSEKLLTEEERDVCQKIAAAGDELTGPRATVLLAIDEGATRAQASEQTGLTVGQIGYLLRVFRQKHLAMFPDAPPIEEEPAAPEEAGKPKGKGKKKAKAKKPKKEKKGKKAKAKKKDKKPKKDKKAKAKKSKDAKKKSKKK